MFSEFAGTELERVFWLSFVSTDTIPSNPSSFPVESPLKTNTASTVVSNLSTPMFIFTDLIK